MNNISKNVVFYKTTFNHFYFTHNFLENNKSIGNISNLPANISKHRTSLEISDKDEKLPTGPTILSPGPTLFKQVTTALKAEVKSIFCNDIINNEEHKIIKYKIKYVWILLTVFLDTC